MSVLRKALEVY